MTTPKADKPEATPKKRGTDPELQAIARIDRILADFSPGDATRIMRYIQEKTYGRLVARNGLKDATDLVGAALLDKAVQRS